MSRTASTMRLRGSAGSNEPPTTPSCIRAHVREGLRGPQVPRSRDCHNNRVNGAGLRAWVTRPSQLSADPGARRWSAVVLALGFVFLLLPRSHGWSLLHVYKEDGYLFLHDAASRGLAATFDQYAGFVLVGPRLLASGCGALPPEAYAGCVGASVDLVRVLIAFVALLVLTPYAASWRWGLAAAAAVVFVPLGQQEVLGNLTNLRWFGDVAAVLVLLGAFTSRRGAVGAGLLAALAALTDPLVLGLAPLALLRCWQLRGWARLPAVALLAGCVTQLLLLQPAVRSVNEMSVAQWLENGLVRGPLLAQYGRNGAIALATVLPIVLVLVASVLILLAVLLGARAAASAGARDTVVVVAVLVLGAFGFVVASLRYAALGSLEFDDPYLVAEPTRYSLAPALLLTMALLLGAGFAWSKPQESRRTLDLTRLVVFGSIAVVALAVVADVRVDRWTNRGPLWSDTVEQTRQACADGATMVLVDFTPSAAYTGGATTDWSRELACSWFLR